MGYRKLLLLAVIFSLLTSLNVKADNLSDFDKSLKENEQFLRQLKKEEQEQILKKEHKRIIDKEEEKEIKLPRNICFEISEIEVLGVEKLSKKKTDKIIKPYLGQCLYLDDINKIMRDITNFYVEKGYILARAYLPSNQNLSGGKLLIQVLESEIEEIILDENTRLDKLKAYMAFPFERGEVLNVRESDQGFDQLNRLLSNDSKIEYIPGSKQGLVKVKIKTNHKDRSRAKVGFDNSGQESTGEKKRKFIVERDNLLGINDKWFFNYTKDNESGEARLFNKSYNFNLDIPFKFYNIYFSSSRSKYLNSFDSSGITIPFEGVSSYYTYGIARNLYRNRKSKIGAALELNIKDSRTFKDGILESSSKKFSVLSFGLNSSHHFKNLIISQGLKFSRGTKYFGASRDASGLTYVDPRAQFQKWNYNFDSYKSFFLFNHKFTNKLSLYSQFSEYPLYTAEQIYIGGEYSVRGFKDDSLNGDSGYYINNEIITTIPGLKINNKFFQSYRLKTFLGYDYGFSRMRGGKESNFNRGKGYLSGVAYGLRYNGRRVTFKIIGSEALNHPVSIDNPKREVYYGIDIKLL